MKKFHVTFLIALFSFLTFSMQIMGQETPSSLKLPQLFYKKFVGKMAEQEVEISLTKIDSNLKGNFYNKTTGEVYELIGEVELNGDIILHEAKDQDKEDAGMETEAFLNGKFVSETEMQLSQEKMREDKAVNFNMKETYLNGTAEFELIKEAKQYGKCGYTHCAEFLLIYPKMKNQKQADKFNKIISKILIDEYAAELKKRIKSNDNLETFQSLAEDFINRYKAEEAKNTANPNQIIWGNHHEVTLVCNRFNIITFEFESVSYEGGAYPLTELNYKSYNLQTAEPITLKDVLVQNYESQLNQIGEKIFKSHHGLQDATDLGKEGYTFPNNKFKLSNNYGFTKQGVVFQYNEGEIAPHAMGSPKIIIPYNELKPLIKKNSMLEPFLK